EAVLPPAVRGRGRFGGVGDLLRDRLSLVRIHEGAGGDPVLRLHHAPGPTLEEDAVTLSPAFRPDRRRHRPGPEWSGSARRGSPRGGSSRCAARRERPPPSPRPARPGCGRGAGEGARAPPPWWPDRAGACRERGATRRPGSGPRPGRALAATG